MATLITEADQCRLNLFGARALSTATTVQNSFLLAQQCILNGISGDFVECGVFAGTQIAAMAYACQKHHDSRLVHLFDSFAGIPESGPHDDESITACIGVGQNRLISTGISACSVDQVKAHMNEWRIDPHRLEYHVGWFQDTVPVAKIDKIAILRLDGDLYSSTKVCLDHLYHLVVPGGYIIIDDWPLTGCRKAVDEYLAEHNLTVNVITTVGEAPVYWQINYA